MSTPFIEKNLLKRSIPSKAGRQWIYNTTRSRIPQLVILSLFEIVGSFCSVAFALTSKGLVNAAIGRDQNEFVRIVTIFACLVIFQIFAGTYSYHLSEKLLYTTDSDIKKSVFHDMLTSDYSLISKKHSVDLLHRINADVNTVASNTIAIITSLASYIASIIITSVLLYSVSPLFTFCIIPLSVILTFVTVYLQRNLKTMQKDVSKSSSKLSGFYQESIEKLLIVQGLDVSEQIEDKANILLADRIARQKKRKDLQVKVSLASNLLTSAGSFIALLWCAYKVLNGIIDYGTLVAITSLVSQMQGAILNLPYTIPSCIALTASTERILEVIGVSKQEELAYPDAHELYEEIKGICAKDLSFEYPDQEERKIIFNEASLDINTNGMTVLTGASGCGKSTLLKLLLGLYKPTGGELYFELNSGEKLPINRSTRNLFAFAPQGNLILSGTIRENIMISNPDATEDELNNALYVSAMQDYVNELPQGLDTVLGENGAGLSEGQIQRINIARAVISKAPILLLDEVTSSLDMETEKIVLERTSSLPERTCIAVTHRTAALEITDHQLHFEDGKADKIK